MLTLSEEFQVKRFGFAGCTDENFKRFQCSNNRWVFASYRWILSIYCFVWMVWIWHQGDRLHNFYLTSWGEFVTNLYFLVAAIVVQYHTLVYYSRKPLDHDNGDETVELLQENPTTVRPKWYNCVLWVLMETAATISLCVFILYWSLNYIHSRAHAKNSVTSFHRHLCIPVLLVIDVLLVAVPVRILHFYHPVGLACIYILTNIMLHVSGQESRVYFSLDWENNPRLAAGLCIATVFVIVPLLHLFVTALYRLRMAVFHAFRDKGELGD